MTRQQYGWHEGIQAPLLLEVWLLLERRFDSGNLKAHRFIPVTNAAALSISRNPCSRCTLSPPTMPVIGSRRCDASYEEQQREDANRHGLPEASLAAAAAGGMHRQGEQQQNQIQKMVEAMDPRRSSRWIRGSLLGTGAYGSVSLALDTETSELFAVKSVVCDDSRPWHELLPEIRALEHELGILQRLQSPHIVRCLGADWSLEKGLPTRNLFLEHMPGGSLADLMKKFGGVLEERLARGFARGILQGLHYLHSSGIVHCDIKGKNVLVGASGVKLADFGAAKMMDASGGAVAEEQQNHYKGTPLWMAPEVARHEEQGPASDIWSLGCTVVEMITGRAPWSELIKPGSDKLVALYHIGCSDRVPKVPAEHQLSPAAADFLSRCLKRDARERWTSAQLLLHPFVLAEAAECGGAKLLEPSISPPSPCSTLDCLQNSSSTTMSLLQEPVPLLKKLQFCQQQRKEEISVAPKPELDATTTSNAKNWWGNSARRWIVVRSPKSSKSQLEQPEDDLPAKLELSPMVGDKRKRRHVNLVTPDAIDVSFSCLSSYSSSSESQFCSVASSVPPA